jgi:hypothetical protein
MSDEQFKEYEKEYKEFVNDLSRYEKTINLFETENDVLKNYDN